MNAKEIKSNNQISKESKPSARKAVAHALLLTALVGQVAFCMPQAFAQGISPDQDSLLPPEVVPLDAAGNNNFAAAPAQGMAPAVGNSMPSSSAPAFNPGEMQTAQQWRKAAFDSMQNNPNVTPAFSHQNPALMSQQGQMGQMPGQMGQNGTPGLGQSPWMNAQGQPMTGAAQTQTLSGAVAQQPNQNPNGKKGSKLNGISHSIGLVSLFGGGMLMGSLLSGRAAINPMSTGLMGVGLSNYALRGMYY
jgi:hypothetical protein